MRVDMFACVVVAGIVATLFCLSMGASAEATGPRIGPPQVLAHHRHYNRHYDPPWPDPYDTPAAICAARDGDEIVVSVQHKLLWLNANTGAKIRETIPPFPTTECAMLIARRGDESVLVYVGSETLLNLPQSDFTLTVSSRDGKRLSTNRWRMNMQSDGIDLQLAGDWLYFNRREPWGHSGPVRSFHLDTLTEGRSFDIPGYSGLFGDGREVHAISNHLAAFRLTQNAAAQLDERPGASLVMRSCPDRPDVLPVALRDGSSIAIDLGRPGAECFSQEGFNLRDGGGRLISRRPIRDGSWMYESFILPWDDGLRVVAQRSEVPGFQIWKVPIAF